MNEIVIAEIENTRPLNFIATMHFSPVWRYLLYLDEYVKHLPFMADSDSYTTEVIVFGNVVIDYLQYYPALSLEECMNTDASFFADGPDLYIHGNNHAPVWFYYSKQYGVIYGFTNRGVRRFNKNVYQALIESIPSISESVDPIEYSRMAFNGGSLVLGNTTEYFDQLAPVFGNDVNLKIGPDDGHYESLKSIAKYYIENYSPSITSAKFSLKDKRELLSAKAPNTYFTAATYPDIEDNKLGKIVPDAFGELLGVPGICVNGKATESAKVFKFGAVITRLDAIYVYKDEQWTEVSAASASLATGEITLSTANAHVDGSTSKGIVKVKIDGLFRPEVNPGDVIAKINEVYGGIEYLPGNYKISEWEAELGALADIGLYLNSAKDINEWIEQIQNGSTIGFQYMIEYDKITARLDNPNRTVAVKIQAVEILNIEEIEVDYNATIYATSALVRYAKDQDSGDSPQIVNDEFKQAVLEVHRKEKEYETDSLLPDAPSATEKAAVIMDDQKAIRPIFRGVKVSGLKWFDRRLYDIIEAEISIPGIHVVAPYPFGVTVICPNGVDETVIEPGYLDFKYITPDAEDVELLNPIQAASPALEDYKLIEPGYESMEEINPMGVRGRQIIKNTDREFMGTVRCQIVGRKPNLENCVVSFDLRQRDYSEVIEAVLEG